MVKFFYKRLRKGAGRMEAKLLAFLYRARRMHSAQGGGPGGEFADGPYLYRDDRLGEGPFAGRESLWAEGRPGVGIRLPRGRADRGTGLAFISCSLHFMEYLV